MALVKLPMFSVDRIWLSSLGCLTVEYLCCFEVAKESCRNDVRYISVSFETGSHVALVGLLVCSLSLIHIPSPRDISGSRMPGWG